MEIYSTINLFVSLCNGFHTVVSSLKLGKVPRWSHRSSRWSLRGARGGASLIDKPSCWSPGTLIAWHADHLGRWSPDMLITWHADHLTRWSAGTLINLVRWAAGTVITCSCTLIVPMKNYQIFNTSNNDIIRIQSTCDLCLCPRRNNIILVPIPVLLQQLEILWQTHGKGVACWAGMRSVLDIPCPRTGKPLLYQL